MEGEPHRLTPKQTKYPNTGVTIIFSFKIEKKMCASQHAFYICLTSVTWWEVSGIAHLSSAPRIHFMHHNAPFYISNPKVSQAWSSSVPSKPTLAPNLITRYKALASL